MVYNIIMAWLRSNSIVGNGVLAMLYYTALYPIVPRFIISMRELYDRDLHGRWQGIDAGFGMSSQPVSGGNEVVSAIEFGNAAVGQEQGQVVEGEVGDSEAIQLET
jgi:hypothetical protein